MFTQKGGKTNNGHGDDADDAAVIHSSSNDVINSNVEFDVEEARTAIGIQFTNGFEINVIDVCGRALYPTISRINHSCIPNVTHANVKKQRRRRSGSKNNASDDSNTGKAYAKYMIMVHTNIHTYTHTHTNNFLIFSSHASPIHGQKS